jgi:thymidylate kinase
VLDRYVADMVVDRTRRLHWSDQQIARQIGFAYRTGFPRPDLTIILDCSLAVVVARRPDENPQVLEERAALYRRVAAIIAAPIVDAGQPVERVAEDVWQIVAANKVVESSVMR